MLAIMEALTAPLAAVIVVVPTLTPVTKPVASTAAVLELTELHIIAGCGFKAVPNWSSAVAVNCALAPTIIDTIVEVGVKAIEVRTGAATAKLEVALTAPLEAVIIAVPALTPVASPEASTVAIVELLELQVIAGCGFKAIPNWSRAEAVNC